MLLLRLFLLSAIFCLLLSIPEALASWLLGLTCLASFAFQSHCLLAYPCVVTVRIMSCSVVALRNLPFGVRTNTTTQTHCFWLIMYYRSCSCYPRLERLDICLQILPLRGGFSHVGESFACWLITSFWIMSMEQPHSCAQNRALSWRVHILAHNRAVVECHVGYVQNTRISIL